MLHRRMRNHPGSAPDPGRCLRTGVDCVRVHGTAELHACKLHGARPNPQPTCKWPHVSRRTAWPASVY